MDNDIHPHKFHMNACAKFLASIIYERIIFSILVRYAYIPEEYIAFNTSLKYRFMKQFILKKNC